MRKNASDPIGTLSVGNVVSAGVTLYKSNFRDYFLVSLRSIGWIVVAILAVVPLSIVGAVLGPAIGVGVTILFLAIIWIGVLLFCVGKYAVNRAIISRLAYQQLINQPETVKDATAHLAGSNWKFLRLSLWLGLFVSGVVILAYLALLLCALLGGVLGSQIQGPIGTILAIIFVIGGIVAAVMIVIRFYSAWFVSELPLAIESPMEALDSIGRSRQLSSPFISRIVLVVLVAFLVTLPLNIVANTPSIIAYVGLMDSLKQISSNPEALNAAVNSSSYTALQLVSSALTLILEIFILPFWQAIKSIIYFDLRGRREGNDLQLR